MAYVRVQILKEQKIAGNFFLESQNYKKGLQNLKNLGLDSDFLFRKRKIQTQSLGLHIGKFLKSSGLTLVASICFKEHY